MVKRKSFGGQTISDLNLVLPVSSYVIRGKLTNLLASQFLHLENGNECLFHRFVVIINEVLGVKHLS